MNSELLETTRAEILLGRDCEAFFHTDPGRYVKARAMDAVYDAIEALKAVDPTDAAEISRIQLDLKSAENALSWLNEAIRNGRQAMQQLQIMASEEE